MLLILREWMAGEKAHLAGLTGFSPLIYELVFRSFLLRNENDFRQGPIELMDLAVHEPTVLEAF